MRSNWSAATITASLVAAAALIGCGADVQSAKDTTSVPISRELSMEQFRTGAQRACAELVKESRALPDVLPPDYSVMARSMSKFVASTDRFLRAMHDLTPPKEIQPSVDRFVDWYATQLLLARRLQRATEAHDGSQITSLTQMLLDVVQDRSYGYAKQYGLGGCN